MALRLHLTPDLSAVDDNNGIGRIVHAQYKYLPAYGIEFVGNPEQADVTACHIEGQGRQVDILSCHGLYFQDIPHDPYMAWHHETNKRIAATARGARAITVPSPWVTECFKRDLRIDPVVIGHGIDIADWEPLPASERRGYVLWAKSRASDVCSPVPAAELARRRIPVVSTFGDSGPQSDALFVIGPQPFGKMRTFIRHASVYLATTPETFGIQTLEAMASGTPILGYKWAGTADLVEHGITGWLVEPGDIEGLHQGYYEIANNWQHYSTNATVTGRSYTWDKAMRAYADLYHRVAEEKARERHRVCVVVTSYNYGKYLSSAVHSVMPQLDAEKGDEIVIVNDGSTDDTDSVGLDLLAVHAAAGVRYQKQDNQGVAAARNNGIVATDCEYIICLDADDQLAPDYIRVCRTALKQDRALGITYTGLGFLNDNGTVAPTQFPPDFDWEHQATPGNPPRTCVPTAAMFRRSLWERAGGYKQAFAPAEDAEFYTRGLSAGFTAHKVADEPYIWYRNHPGSASKTRKYFDYSGYHPWMRDKQYPMAAPSDRPPTVLSYARPLISVIIPVGPGHARYLPAAIDSLLMQSYRQWECIIINDSGEDLELSAYPFCKVLATEGRRGPGKARNVGLHAATAPLVLFLDADDWLADPDALKQMLAQQAKTGKYVYTDWFCIENRGNASEEEERKAREWLASKPTHRIWRDEKNNLQLYFEDDAAEYNQERWFQQGYHAITALIPTDWARAVGGFDESLSSFEDWDFFAKLAARGFCGIRLPQKLLGYRKHSGTMRNKGWDNKQSLIPIIQGRYQGVTPMACACGPAGAALLRIRKTLTEGDLMGMELQPGQTLMEYNGGNSGTVSVQSRVKRVDGRPVRYFYDNGSNRLIAVWNEDVGFMESIGFRPALEAAVSAPVAPTPASIGDAISAALRPAQSVQAPVPTPSPVPPSAPPPPPSEQSAQERAEAVTPEPDVANAAEVSAAFQKVQGALAAQLEEKAAQHHKPGRPRKQG